MQLISSVIAMRETSRSVHRSGGKIVLVPTMGAVHEGHLALVREAARHGDQVIVSIFVNPTQFGPKEDIQAYPRSAEEDWDKLEATALVHTVFAPSTREMYPTPDMLTWVQVNKISDHLCGGSREGHFRGVATVVTKLFNICHPDVAIFGLKDAQQFYLLRRLALDLNMDIELIGVPTVREPDGLALSSRNKYLSPEERSQATVLIRAVSEAKERILNGERNGRAVVKLMRSILAGADLGRIDYADVVDSESFQPVDHLNSGQIAVAAVAVQFSKARLIDNAIVEVT